MRKNYENRAIYEELSQRIQSSEEFKNHFLSEPKSVLQEMRIKVPDLIAVKVHEDTAKVKNFVIPASLSDEDRTTASNPLFRHAINKAYADVEFKTELINSPKSAIAKLTGEKPPKDLDIRVHENTATLRPIVISFDSTNEELSDRELKTVAGGGFGSFTRIKPPIAGGSFGTSLD